MQKPWPWEENPKDWNKTLLKSLFLNFVNLCTYVPFFLYNEAKLKIPYVLDLSETPSLWTIIKVFTFIVIPRRPADDNHPPNFPHRPLLHIRP
jgi:hypothetical protein